MSARMTYNHEFYCTQCGKKGIPVSRKKNHLKEQGHLKKLFCVHCNKEVNHVEVIENSQYDKQIFMDEFSSGNFDIEGNRRISLKEWKRTYYGNKETNNDNLDKDVNLDDMMDLFLLERDKDL